MRVLGAFRWLVFVYSRVTSNAIPVFYNSFECFQIFTRLYLRRKRIPNFWSKRSYALITKANLIDFRNIKIKSILTTNHSIVTVNLKISFINDGFNEFILL